MTLTFNLPTYNFFHKESKFKKKKKKKLFFGSFFFFFAEGGGVGVGGVGGRGK